MEFGFQLVEHPPYTSDLSLLNYNLFPNEKKQFVLNLGCGVGQNLLFQTDKQSEEDLDEVYNFKKR